MRTKDSDITSLDDARVWHMIRAAQDAPPRPLIPYGFGMDAEARKHVEEMIESITATAINQDRDAKEALGQWEEKVEGCEPIEPIHVLAAFVAGIHAGSVAVARQWVKKSPETMFAYYALGGRLLMRPNCGQRRTATHDGARWPRQQDFGTRLAEGLETHRAGLRIHGTNGSDACRSRRASRDAEDAQEPTLRVPRADLLRRPPIPGGRSRSSAILAP